VARPNVYDAKETMALICDLIARKQTLNQICQLPNMPSHETVRQWLLNDSELAANYACARELRADARADRIDEITAMIINGELDPQAAKVVIDAEKWLAGKEMPKRYGDKVTQEVTGKDGGAIQTESRVQIYIPDNGRN
jgi:hypothetical protein